MKIEFIKALQRPMTCIVKNWYVKYLSCLYFKFLLLHIPLHLYIHSVPHAKAL